MAASARNPAPVELLLALTATLSSCSDGGNAPGGEEGADLDVVEARPAAPTASDPPSNSGLAAARSRADDDRLFAEAWRPTNIGGGGAFQVVRAGPGGQILLGSDLGGAYRSTDGGSSWTPIGASSGMTVTHVSGVGFDAVSRSILYIGTESGIFRSDDDGRRFSKVLDRGYVTAIEFAASPPVGYAAVHSRFNRADGTIFRTSDRGLSWHKTESRGLPSDLHILKIIVDPKHPDRLYALSGEGRFACGRAALFRSLDGGGSWTALTAGLGQITDVGLDRARPNIIYVSTYGDVFDAGYDCVRDDPKGGFLYRSENRGSTWTKVTNDRRNTALWVDRTRTNSVRMVDIDRREVWAWSRTTGVTRVGGYWDSGRPWHTGWSGRQPNMSFGGDPLTFAEDPSDPDVLYWADSQFAYRVSQKGRRLESLTSIEVASGRWQSRGVENTVLFRLEISRADHDRIYAAYADLGCVRSEDGGQSWAECNDPRFGWRKTGGNVMTVAADPSRPKVVWMTMAPTIERSHHTLVRSQDGGASWQSSEEGLPPGKHVPSGLSVDESSPQARRTLFVTYGGDLYRSMNDGGGWSLVFRCGGCRVTAVDPRPPGHVLTGGEAGLFLSTDGGQTFTEVGGRNLRGSGTKFWRGRGAWSGVSAIVFDRERPRRVYAVKHGMEGGGLYRSVRGGAKGTWRRVQTDPYMRDVAVGPGPRLITASSFATYHGGYRPESRGVRLSIDEGRSFVSANEGLAWPFAQTLAVDAGTPRRVFVGVPGLGIFRRSL